MTNLIFDLPLEDIDDRRLLPYDGQYVCYLDRDRNVVYHGDKPDMLWDLEFSPGGVECIGASWYDLYHALRVLFDDTRILDSTSSAGDWCLAFQVGKTWYPAWQENMHPTRGYRWTISHEFPARDLDELWAILTQE